MFMFIGEKDIPTIYFHFLSKYEVLNKFKSWGMAARWFKGHITLEVHIFSNTFF